MKHEFKFVINIEEVLVDGQYQNRIELLGPKKLTRFKACTQLLLNDLALVCTAHLKSEYKEAQKMLEPLNIALEEREKTVAKQLADKECIQKIMANNSNQIGHA